VNEPKVPVFLAVGLWVGSALAVLTYTYIAFKETAGGAESGAAAIITQGNPIVASQKILAAEAAGAVTKPLNRNKFKPSR